MDSKDLDILKSMRNLKTNNLQTIADTVNISKSSAKNYELVMPDADLDKVVPHLISSFYGNAGERCLAGSAHNIIR